MNKIIFVAIVFASISAVGVLSSNLISLTIQPVRVFDSIEDFDNPVCTCLGSDGEYSMTNCQAFQGPYTDPHDLCIWEAGIEPYGDPPSAAQGCGVGFWKNSVSDESSNLISENENLEAPSHWPPGYHPDYYYNDMFHTTFFSGTEFFDDSQTQGATSVTQDDQEISNGIHFTQNIATLDDEEEEKSEEISESDDHIDDDAHLKPKDGIISVKEKSGKEKSDKEKSEDDNNTVDEEDNEKDESEEVNTAKAGKGKDKPPSDDELEITLGSALNAKGGKLNSLLRHSVAALLNAAHADVNYQYTVTEVISMTQFALATEDYKTTSDIFEDLNDNSEKPPLCSG